MTHFINSIIDATIFKRRCVMSSEFLVAFTFIVAAPIFVGITLLIGALLRPRAHNTVGKATTYECGEIPYGSGWFQYNPRYYIFAVIFLIFDVELALIFPVAAVYRGFLRRGHGPVAFFEIMLFVAILFAALIYCWKKGDLKWIKDPKTLN